MSLLRESLGTRIRQLRKINGWTIEQLAAKAGMEAKYLGAVERGERNITVDNIEKIIAGFSTEPYKLFLFSTEGTISEEEIIDDKIIDILKVCNKKVKRTLFIIFQAVWDLMNEK